MRKVKAIIQLTLHSISFHLKFPAKLSLQLLVNKTATQILTNLQLNANPIKIRNQIVRQVQWDFNEERRQFEELRLKIVIYIRTNNNPNKITAGIIELNLSDPTYRAVRVVAKPVRCNDDRANLQYSIRSVLDFGNLGRGGDLLQSRSGLGGSKVRSCEKEFNSSILYKNKEMLNAEECSENELFKYLHDSQNESSGRRERRHRSSMKGGHRGWVDDESKTERRSYGLNRSSQALVPRRQYSQDERNRQLIALNENIKKQVEENRGQIEKLTLENKDLKGKIKQLQTDLGEQELIVRSLTKKMQLKQGNSGDEVKQLRIKLQQNEVEIHRLINEKDEMLNNLQAKEKEWLLAAREKERVNGEERRKLLSQLQGREDHESELSRELTRLKQDYKVMEVMKEQIVQEKDKMEVQVQKFRCQISKLQIELTKANQDVSQLQDSLKVKLQSGISAKAQKKMMHELQMQKEQTELMVAQKQTQIDQMRTELERLRVQMKGKGQNLLELRKEVESSKILIENLKGRQRNLLAKVNRYQNELKNDTKQTSKIDKHVREIELELSKIKLEADYTNASKVKKISEYQRINDLLNKKIELFAQQNIQLSAQKMQIIDKYKSKEDENFDLGQQLIVAKENLLSMQSEIQSLIQDNEYLLKQIKLLDLREDQIYQLKEKQEHSEKIVYELQQNYQLREIQLVNEIKLLNSIKEERQDQIKELNQNVTRLERQNLAHETQIEGLEYSLKNKEAEFEYLKHDIDRERKNNIQFEERMIILKRSENTSLSSIQQLRQDNIAYQKMLAQNEQAIKALGKRYESLYKSVLDSLNRFFEIIKSGKNLANQSIRNEKPDIANVLNDCIRYLAQEKKQQLQEYNKLKSQYLGQSDKNRENAKMINIKIQIQQELQREITALKEGTALFQTRIATHDKQIVEYQGQVKDKMATIKELNLSIENMKRQNKNQIAKNESIINSKLLEIKKLQEQLASQIQFRKSQQKLLQSKIQATEQDCQAKIAAINTKYTQLQSTWKGDKQSLRLLKLKMNENQKQLTKLTKQKVDIQAQIDNKTKELIAARVESEYKSKIITEKQLEISEQRKTVDRLDKEKQNLQSRRKGMQEGNKTLVIARNQLQESVKSKNNEIAQIRIQMSALEASTAKLLKQKEQFQKYKKLQIENLAKLNQTIKILKESTFVNDDTMNKINLQKENMEKEYTKKINILNKSIQTLQKQLKDSTIKNTEKQNEFAKKNTSILNQLKEIKLKNQEYVKTIETLRIEIDNYSNMTLKAVQKAQDLKSKKRVEDPNAGKYQQFLDFVSDLKVLGNTSQINRAKFKKLTPPTETQKFPSLPECVRELNITLNRIKIKVLNKPNLPQEIKTFLLEDIKNVQIIVQKLSKSSGK